MNTSLYVFGKKFDALKPKKTQKATENSHCGYKNIELIYHLVKERGFTLKAQKSI